MLTPERLAEIKARCENQWPDAANCHEAIDQAQADCAGLLAEVERLRWLATTARALVESEQHVKPFATVSLIDRRPLLDCPFCGSGRVNGGVGHEEGCEWAEFAEAVRALDAGHEKTPGPPG